MENKINIAELLKDCPSGMELYSPIFGEVYLDKIRPHLAIVVTTDKEQGDFKEEFLYDGRYGMNGECMLFPSKGKTTWEGFQRPFKDGDVVVGKNYACSYITIFKEFIDNTSFSNYVCLTSFGSFKVNNFSDNANLRLATEEEKEKLFKAIKDNGYKWNSETKTLDKLITPKKFDITTLKPFDKVLVRDSDKDMWCASIFSHTWKNLYYCVGIWHNQCIPYEGNEHLLGTTDDCDKFYKNW